MALRVETPIFGPDTNQYAGRGQPSVTLEQMAGICRLFEEIGFDGITTAEAGHDAFLPLMIAAANTGRMNLGTNVAIAFPRSPMVTAQMAWDLAHFTGGRFNLGLGTQVKGHNERRYSTPWPSAPGPRMREYLLCLKAIFQSFQHPEKPSYFQGEFYQFTLIAPFFNPGPIAHPDVPLYISAVGPYMARLSGELCEGLRLHPISTFTYTKDVIVPAVAEGAARAGRDPACIDLVGAPFLATGRTESDVEQARNSVRKQIAFYASTRSYHTVLAHHGWEDVGLALHRLSVAGKWDEMPALITDEMLEEWAVVATYDRLADEVRAKADGLFQTVTLTLLDEARRDVDLMRDTIKRLHQD